MGREKAGRIKKVQRVDWPGDLNRRGGHMDLSPTVNQKKAEGQIFNKRLWALKRELPIYV